MSRAAGPALAILLLAGCGVRPTGVVYAGDAPVATASGSPRSQVFLLSDGGIPTPVRRPADPADPQRVFDALLSGPTQEERARGLTTELTGIKKIAVHDLDGRALLVEAIPPVIKLPAQAYAQIYCTGLLLSAQTVVKISYLDGGAKPYGTPHCPGAEPIPSSPTIGPPSGART
jgi:hypothetical protein